ncbi:MAG: hypothetical protein AAGC81_02280 [Pseudomonadota bacterium]
MSFVDAQMNQSRVSRMCEALGHIEKSAASQKATQEEIATLLAPVIEKLAELGLSAGAGAATEEPVPYTTGYDETVAERPVASISPDHAHAPEVTPMTAKRRALSIAQSKTDRALRQFTAALAELDRASRDPI